MISGSERRGGAAGFVGTSILPQLGNSNRLFVSMITIAAIPVLYIHAHIQTYAFTLSNRPIHFVVVFGICVCIYGSCGPSIPSLPYPLPPHHTGSTELLVYVPPSRYGPSSLRFKISCRHQNSLLQTVLPHTATL